MHKFYTLQGNPLWYDVITNRISSFIPSKEKRTFPIIHFIAPTIINTSQIKMFTIEMTQQCNLRCKYCCYSGEYNNRRKHNCKNITYDTLHQVICFIKRCVENNTEEVTICFYGGEALLVREKIDWFIKHIRSEIECPIIFSLSTNGFALTESVIDWVCSYDNLNLTITVDGNRIMHDANRITQNNHGSYDTIIKNLETFKNKYPEEYKERVQFISTVYSWNDVIKLSEVWDQEKILRHNYPIHISTIIPNFNNNERTYDSWQVKNEFYNRAFEEFKIKGNSILTSCFQRLIDIVEHRDFNELPTILELKTCYQELWSTYVNADGDIYACEKICDDDKVGNVFEGFKQEYINSLLEKFTSRKNKYCSRCWAMRFCRMCMTSLNHSDEEIEKMCKMERDTIDLALRYYCSLKLWKKN